MMRMTPTPRKSHHDWMSPLRSVTFGVCVFFLGSALALWLTRHNVHGFLALADNFMAAIAAGLMVLLYERWRQREVDRKLRTIRMDASNGRFEKFFPAKSN
jgi:high-affinity Fe2+/Pb2+ permease